MEPWCSLVNTLPCQGRDREFESRRLRHLLTNTRRKAGFLLADSTNKNSPDKCPGSLGSDF